MITLIVQIENVNKDTGKRERESNFGDMPGSSIIFVTIIKSRQLNKSPRDGTNLYTETKRKPVELMTSEYSYDIKESSLTVGNLSLIEKLQLLTNKTMATKP